MTKIYGILGGVSSCKLIFKIEGNYSSPTLRLLRDGLHGGADVLRS